MQNFSVLLSWENCLIFFPDLLSREIAAYPGVKHIADRFDGQVKIIELAKKCFSPEQLETDEIPGGKQCFQYILFIFFVLSCRGEKKRIITDNSDQWSVSE